MSSPRKSVLINDIYPLKKLNTHKKRLIVSSTVVYKLDSLNKKKDGRRRSLSQIIIPEINQNFNDESNQNPIIDDPIDQTKSNSKNEKNNISRSLKKNRNKKNLNKSTSYSNMERSYIKYNKKYVKINRNASWRNNVIQLEKFSINQVKKPYESFIKENYDMKKIILIQSFFRMYNFRKLLYSDLMKYYTRATACKKLNNILFVNIKNLVFRVLHLISKFKKHKYFINKKEYDLLMELHKTNIFCIKDLVNYFNDLLKKTPIILNKNDFSDNQNYNLNEKKILSDFEDSNISDISKNSENHIFNS